MHCNWPLTKQGATRSRKEIPIGAPKQAPKRTLFGKERPMHQLLLIGASLPLFVVIGWALLSPNQVIGDQPEGNMNWD